MTWSPDRIGEALVLVSQEAGITRTSEFRTVAYHGGGDADDLSAWLGTHAKEIGVNVIPTALLYGGVEEFLASPGPSIIRLPDRTLVVKVRGGHRRVRIITPDFEIEDLPLETVRNRVCEAADAPARPAVDAFLERVGIAGGRLERARKVVLADRLVAREVAFAWTLERSQSEDFRAHLRTAGVTGGFFLLPLLQILGALLGALVWTLSLRWSIGNTPDRGWLAAWFLGLMSLIPVSMLAQWVESLVILRSVEALKRRLLYGALQLDPEDVRSAGVATFFGQVAETQTVEATARKGAAAAIVVPLQLVLALGVFLWSGNVLPAALLVIWTIAIGRATRVFVERRRTWTDLRSKITKRMIENLIGHRTRASQENPEQWHEREDQELSGYVRTSQRMDRAAVILAVLVRSWPVVGVLCLAPTLLLADLSPFVVAAGFGGVLVAAAGFIQWAASAPVITDAYSAWRIIEPTFDAATRSAPVGRPLTTTPAPGDSDVPVLAVRDVVFTYPRRVNPVLNGCSFDIRASERILLHAPSGGGKSTLVSIMVGLRLPDSGVLLLHGLDVHTVGVEAWRRRAASAPQFQENHVFTDTLAFNLLMGRRWPARTSDFDEATSLCKELGLGPLLSRMPAGLLQIVGEGGWQLSHGERSRIFLARALLQSPDLLVLDESLSALDPEHFASCLNVVLARARTLVLIAHQ